LNVPPEETRTKNRRKNLNKLYNSAEWKKARKEFLDQHGYFCDWCGATKYLEIHHPMRNVYGTDLYTDFVASQCVVLCRSCHYATEHNRVLCPRCKEHYKFHDAEVCSYCYLKEHPEVKERVELNKVLKRKKQRELRKKQRELIKKAKKKYERKSK